MARKRVVSRTITTTIVTAMVTDVLEAKCGQVTVAIGGGLKDKALEKAVKKTIEESENLKFNCILETHEEGKLYVMPEEKFIALAEVVEK